jgi:hypothetical protein
MSPVAAADRSGGSKKNAASVDVSVESVVAAYDQLLGERELEDCTAMNVTSDDAKLALRVFSEVPAVVAAELAILNTHPLKLATNPTALAAVLGLPVEAVGMSSVANIIKQVWGGSTYVVSCC